MGVKGRMWRVIKKMYMSSRSAVLLEGEKSDSFNVDQGVAQGCSLSSILFSVFINDLLKEVEQVELGIQLSSGKTFGGMLFADDFVGVSDSKENLQKLIDVVYSYCSKWRLRANVIKSAVMVFSKDAVNGCWKWGEYSLPKVSSYSYLGIDFSSNGAWDMHIKKLLDNGRKKVNQLHKVISNRNVNLSTRSSHIVTHFHIHCIGHLCRLHSCCCTMLLSCSLHKCPMQCMWKWVKRLLYC